MSVMIDCFTVEDETVTLGPFERVVFSCGGVEADDVRLAEQGDLWWYCEQVKYHDGQLTAINLLTVRSV